VTTENLSAGVSPATPSRVTDQHWLIFADHPQGGVANVTRCVCGFPADVESDCGYGDSVLKHIEAEIREQIARDIEAETVFDEDKFYMLDSTRAAFTAAASIARGGAA